MTCKTFMLGDLRALLAPLSNTRKQAVLFALDTGTSLDDTVMLGWKDGLRKQTTEFGRELIRAQPRHRRLDYVFWEYLEDGSAAPLFGLENSVSEVTMVRSFGDLKALYDRMVWINSKVEAECFVRALNLALEG
ncbi:hypothetical protein [Paraburkholderia fungorum]|uniref:hypothetical protein n=1 Tax=Paraburkholderia fungorum TaxID=134537 RepID=UPI0020937521|nr:hypothetical protein [Paraburkholderia fungorum]USU18453.1 hypothetical protein NFE55_22555 [Paraburkholderia fungorum]USU26484.1 hypothetical protein NFS19_22410 [Paraburkholderia fungorum]